MNEIIIFGKRPVLEVAQHFQETILEIYLAKTIDKKTFNILKTINKPIILLDFKKAQALAKGKNHQGFFLKIKAPSPCDISFLKRQNNLLVLDEITDSGNLGAIARSAYTLGINGVIFIGNVDLVSVIRASSGAFLSLPFYFCKNALDLVHELKMANFTLVGADLGGEDLSNFGTNLNKFALFLGNEEMGLSKKLKAKLDKIVTIPMMKNFNSLNVSVSAGILIYNFMKGRNRYGCDFKA